MKLDVLLVRWPIWVDRFQIRIAIHQDIAFECGCSETGASPNNDELAGLRGHAWVDVQDHPLRKAEAFAGRMHAFPADAQQIAALAQVLGRRQPFVGIAGVKVVVYLRPHAGLHI